ncbi:MAG TPA: hypothetical protein VI277_08295 [Candidatus Limnocylindria bacterium]
MPDETPAASVTPAASAPAPSTTANCVEDAVVAAIDQFGHGNLDTDPSREEIAVALELLDLAGAEAEARDSFVVDLRNDSIEEMGMQMSYNIFRAAVALPRC